MIPIRKEMEILDRYVELEEVRLKTPISLIYNVNNKIDVNTFVIPSFMIQPLIENVIWHGLAPQKRAGQITVKFEIKGEHLYIEIADNGVGISEKIEKEKTHSTEIVVKRLELLSKQYNTKFEFERENKRDEKGDIMGCVVSITIPKIILDEGTDR